MRLSIRDSHVDGTFEAEVRTKTDPGFGAYISIRSGDRLVGAIAIYKQSDEEAVLVDTYLRTFLNVKNDDWVEVQDCHPEPAESISIASTDRMLVDDEIVSKIRAEYADKPVCKGYMIPLFFYMSSAKQVIVTGTHPEGIVTIQSTTKITIDRQYDDSYKEQPLPNRPTWGDIGGLDREINEIRHRIEYPLRNGRVFAHFGADVPRGILLTGPPGTGKTLIARALANEAGAHIEIIQGPQIMTPYLGQSEQTLFDIFEKARVKAPSIILIDEFDSLASRRETTRSEANSRIVAALLVLMDGLKPMENVVVIGTTNRPEDIDEALRRPGRFDREIMIGIPDKAGRRKILEIHTMKTKHMPLAADVDFDKLAQISHGFTGADIASLCREAGYSALFRYFTDAELQTGRILPDSNMQVTQHDFLQAMRSVQPTAMRSGMVEDVRDVKWEDVGGLSEVKELLEENMRFLITQSEEFERVGFRPAKGILLYGESGTGKTMIARALANHFDIHLITLRGPETHRKWFGESEELVRKVFAKARQVAPCILLIDEVDALVPVRGNDLSGARESITSQTITELERIGTTDQVLVIATTNQPAEIDPALRRPGRLDVEIHVGKPNDEERKQIFSVQLKKVQSKDIDFDELAKLTKDFSGADIAECCRRAVLQVLKQTKSEQEQAIAVTMQSLRDAISKVRQTDRFKRFGRIGFHKEGEND